MSSEPLTLRRLPVRLTADPTRTITRFFWAGPDRARKVIDRIMGLDERQAADLLASTMRNFAHLHIDLDEIFLAHHAEVAHRVDMPASLTPDRKRLIGAFFTLEYAFASAALFNPSMAPAINQDGLEPGALRFAMSLRCVGEGHISSVVFRRGVIDGGGDIAIEPVGRYHEPLRRAENHPFSKARFRVRLAEMGVRDTVADTVLGPLNDPFTLEDLRNVLYHVQTRAEDTDRNNREARSFEWLGGCDYDIVTSPDADITEAVLFPMCEAESQGMEDMRIVRFTDDDGSVRHHGTYTAFNGQEIMPQLITMLQPGLAQVRSLRGSAACNKGLALFPRKIGGRYMRTTS